VTRARVASTRTVKQHSRNAPKCTTQGPLGAAVSPPKVYLIGPGGECVWLEQDAHSDHSDRGTCSDFDLQAHRTRERKTRKACGKEKRRAESLPPPCEQRERERASAEGRPTISADQFKAEMVAEKNMHELQAALDLEGERAGVCLLCKCQWNSRAAGANHRANMATQRVDSLLGCSQLNAGVLVNRQTRRCQSMCKAFWEDELEFLVAKFREDVLRNTHGIHCTASSKGTVIIPPEEQFSLMMTNYAADDGKYSEAKGHATIPWGDIAEHIDPNDEAWQNGQQNTREWEQHTQYRPVTRVVAPECFPYSETQVCVICTCQMGDDWPLWVCRSIARSKT